MLVGTLKPRHCMQSAPNPLLGDALAFLPAPRSDQMGPIPALRLAIPAPEPGAGSKTNYFQRAMDINVAEGMSAAEASTNVHNGLLSLCKLNRNSNKTVYTCPHLTTAIQCGMMVRMMGKLGGHNAKARGGADGTRGSDKKNAGPVC